MPTATPRILLNKEDFIESVKRQVAPEGYGFVPLIGSGISHASGIMVGTALGEYLSYAIWRCVADYEKDGNRGNDGYTLVNKGWPGRPTQRQTAEVRRWATEWYCRLLDQHRIHPDMATGFNLMDLYRPSGTQYRLPPVRPLAFDQATFDNWSWTDPLNRMAVQKLDVIDQAIRELHADRLANGAEGVFTPRQGVSRSSRHYIVETAIRALYDWRLALHFLARLRRIDGLLHLVPECDQYVIDSFNIFITRGRKPCLAHQMVSFLVRPLRIRKLLTTNFDTLLEDAFRDIDIPLQVFAIERNSRLPDPNSVSVHKSLIKLHGSLHETRADFSLDESPDDRDKQTFLQYVWPQTEGQPVALPSHLLVMGTSIPDKRNVELIKYVCDRVSEFRIYVIAHDSRTLDAIDDAFGEEYRRRIIYTVSSSLDLVLYELYQLITHALPPAGFKFEFSQYVPPFEDESDFFPDSLKIGRLPDVVTRTRFAGAESFVTCLQQLVRDAGARVLVLDGECAVTKVGATLFYALKNRERKECLWFELEDFDDPALLLSELFRSISMRLGLYSIENIGLEFPFGLNAVDESELTGSPDENAILDAVRRRIRDHWQPAIERKIRILIQHFGIDPANWCVFFYGRNVAGSCAGFQETPSLWAESSVDWKTPRYLYLSSLMSLLAQNGFRIVYLPYTPLKDAGYQNLRVNRLVEKMSPDQTLGDLLGSGPTGAFQDTVYAAMPAGILPLEFAIKKKSGLAHVIDQVWLRFIGDFSRPDEVERRRRMIYSITLFRQSRHMSAMLSEAVLKSRSRYGRYLAPQSDATRLDDPDEMIEWVRYLYRHDVRFFNRKPGGFAWMFRDVRLLANAMLELPARADHPMQDLKTLRTRIHFWIGEWYLRAFYASNHVDPLKEAIFHKLMSVRNVRHAKLALGNSVVGDTLPYRQALLAAGLSSIAKILMISRESLRYWMAGHQSAGSFYWKSIKAALALDSLHVNTLEEGGEGWDLFCDYVELMLGAERSWRETNPVEQKRYALYVRDLLRDIRRECFKLERDLLRNSNFYTAAANRTNDPADKNPKSLVLAQTDGQHVAVEIELYFGFDPGDQWDDAFKGKLECNSPIVRKQFEAVRELCDKHRCDNDADLLLHIRTRKHEVIQLLLGQSDLLYAFLQLTTEYAYRLIRQAKYENRRLCIRKLEYLEQPEGFMREDKTFGDHDINQHQSKVRRHWELVGVLSQMLQELIHNLDPAYLFREHRLKIRLLTFSGLALGRLGKFHEAHQVLNEAAGVAYGLSVSDSRRELVILRLRRAEVHLLEAMELGWNLNFLVRQYKDRQMPDGQAPSAGTNVSAKIRAAFSWMAPDQDILQQYRLHIAKLDDAWTVLDEVEALLSNCMHSAFWCGKLYYLRLMTYAEHYVPLMEDGELLYRPKACQEQENAGDNLLKILEQGVLSCGEDEYRKLCFLNLIAKSCKKMRRFLEQQRPSGQQHAEEFRTRAIQRLLKVILGVPDDKPLPPNLKWEELLPCGDCGCKGHEFQHFRDGVVANFKRVFGSGERNDKKV